MSGSKVGTMERAENFEPSGMEFGDRYRAACRGSERDLGYLLETTRKYLLYLANRELDDQLRGKVGPSDIVQETFLHAKAAFASFRANNEQDVRSWLKKILLNKLADTRRDFQQAAKRNIRREQPLWGAASAAVRQSRDGHDSPSQIAIGEEETIAIRRLIDLLPSDYQQVIRLRNWERLPFIEIGWRMDRSDDAARKLWFRAVERLRNEWFKTNEQ